MRKFFRKYQIYYTKSIGSIEFRDYSDCRITSFNYFLDYSRNQPKKVGLILLLFLINFIKIEWNFSYKNRKNSESNSLSFTFNASSKSSQNYLFPSPFSIQYIYIHTTYSSKKRANHPRSTVIILCTFQVNDEKKEGKKEKMSAR